MLGFAILMFGMQTMSGAVEPLRENEIFINMLTMFSNPLMGILVGILFTAGLLALLVYFQHADINSLTGGLPPFGAYDGLNDYEHSLYFTIFVMLQFWNMFNAKAFMTGKSAFKGLGSCTWFIAIAFIILLGQVMIVEFGGAMFNVTPLNGSDWIAIIAGTSIVLWIGEIVRLFSKK